MIRRLILFLVLGVLLVGCACAEPYATYTPNGWGTGKPVLKFFGGEINDPAYLASHIIWTTSDSDANITNRVYVPDQSVFIPYENGWKFTNIYRINFYTGYYNLSDKITYFEGNGINNSVEFTGGPFVFSNSNIRSLTPTTFASSINVTHLQNSVFDGIVLLTMTYTPRQFHVYNITSRNQTGVWSTYATNTIDGGSYHDIRFENARGFFELLNATNTTVYNVSAVGTLPLNQVTGIVFAGAGGSANLATVMGGHHNSAWNISLDGASRSGFDLTYFEHDFYGQDIEVNATGHNNFDLHGQWNVTLRNISTRDCLMESFMITTGNFGPNPAAQESDLHIHDKTGAINTRGLTTVSHNISIYNMYVENSSGTDLSINRFIDAYFENVTSYNTNKFLLANFCENLTMVNVTATAQRAGETATLGTSYGTYASEGYANDTKLIDFSLTSDTCDPYVRLLYSRNTTFINMKNDGPVVYYPNNGNDYTNYYYPNIIVVNTTSDPVQNAIVTVNTTTRNGYGAIQTEYRTDENGRLYDNGNRSNWLAVPELFRNDSGLIYYTPNITAVKSGLSDSETVDPDETWYSANKSDLSGPEIILTLDVAGSLPPVSGFSANVTSGNYPLFVAFSDTSTNSPTSWAWDFDNDGVIDSTAQNPVAKYKVKGEYTVSLTTTNADGSDTETSLITVTGTSLTKNITHSVYGYFYNMFYRIYYLGAWL